MDGGKRGNILSRINDRPRLEDCDVIIHLDDGTPRVYTRREVHGTASCCRIKPQTSFEPTFGPSTRPWATLPPPR